ncbi:MAG TPA: deoxynucleoside kinase [Bacteroidales bacterium]|jgi:deoxyadenosine/deoxycytidine kinase|nr:deoxynucleoside kinase [Bacteroidales bacterium]
MTIPYNYIAIEGNIGAGKTTLATRMAQHFNARLILEQFEDNSFLPKFYEDPSRYAFPLELSFLADRFQQLKSQVAVQDMFHPVTIADYFILKSLIFARKTLNTEEFSLYSRLFSIIENVLPKPDLLVYLYLDISRLQSNIRKRGRVYEQKIEDDYLQRIQEGYLDYIRQQPGLRVLLIDTNKLDFVAHQEHFDILVNIITQEYPAGIHRITP